MKLYYTPNACSMACHIALKEAEAPFEAVLVPRGANRSHEHLAVHPDGLVPALELDSGEILTEAVAILLHISRRFPAAKLLPSGGSVDEARVFEWLAWLTNTVHVAYAALWRPERFTEDVSAREALSREGIARIRRLNEKIETRMTTSFAVGHAFSVADAFLFPFYCWNRRIEIDAVSEYPNWTQWARRMTARRSVQDVIVTEDVSVFSSSA